MRWGSYLGGEKSDFFLPLQRLLRTARVTASSVYKLQGTWSCPYAPGILPPRTAPKSMCKHSADTLKKVSFFAKKFWFVFYNFKSKEKLINKATLSREIYMCFVGKKWFQSRKSYFSRSTADTKKLCTKRASRGTTDGTLKHTENMRPCNSIHLWS